MIISSQRFIDDEIVAEKRSDQDYVVTLSPAFEIDGTEYQVVLDGHHSYQAALLDGVDPEFEIATPQQCDKVTVIKTSIDDFLTLCWIDSDWYDIETGADAF